MKRLTIKKPLGFVMHITGMMGSGKTTLIGDMLEHEQGAGKVAYLFTRREGNEISGCWSILPESLKGEVDNSEIILLETMKDWDELYKEYSKDPRQALGVDTSMGLELLAKEKITGSPTGQLISTGGKSQHKLFDTQLSLMLQQLREMAKFTMLVSPADPTVYNFEKGTTDKGQSGTSIDAPKRFSPEGENQRAKTRLLQMCDYAWHIQLEELEGLGVVHRRILQAQANLRFMTKSRLTLGKEIKPIELVNKSGVNWPLMKKSILDAFGLEINTNKTGET